MFTNCRIILFFLAFFCTLSCLPLSAHARPNVGLRTLGVWIPEQGTRLDIAVWYPSVRAPAPLRYEGWIVRAARNGKPASGRFPLILLSHDTSETRFSHFSTASALARAGFVVATPTHHGDNVQDMSLNMSPEQLTQRANDLSAVIDALLANEKIANMLDASRIGVIGFGSGAVSALMLAGALPDGSGWSGYCDRAGANDPYCSFWAVSRMQTMAAGLKMETSYTDPRVKAVVAAAPAYGMFLTAAALAHVRVPVLVIRADAERTYKPELNADILLRNLPYTAEFASFADVPASGLSVACPPELKEELFELCGDVSDSTRAATLYALDGLLNRFFLTHLGKPLGTHSDELVQEE